MRLFSLLTFLPLLAPDDGAGDAGTATGTADTATADLDDGAALDGDALHEAFMSGELGDDPADVLAEGVDFASEDEDDEESQFSDEDILDAIGFGDEGEGEEVSADTPQKAEEEATPPEPGALSDSLKAKLLAAVPDAVVDDEDALVERFTLTNEANREMREVQAKLEGLLKDNPKLEKAVIALLGENPPGVLEALGQAFDEIDIADAYDPADPERSAKTAEERGRLKAHREATAKQAKERQAYLDDYIALTDREFEAYQIEHFAGADGKPDPAKVQAFLAGIERVTKGDPVTGRLMRPAETFEYHRRAQNYDADIQAAVARGRAEGIKAARSRKGSGGGGMPSLGSGRGTKGATTSSASGPKQSIHDRF